jgi:hypothetical protein
MGDTIPGRSRPVNWNPAKRSSMPEEGDEKEMPAAPEEEEEEGVDVRRV